MKLFTFLILLIAVAPIDAHAQWRQEVVDRTNKYRVDTIKEEMAYLKENNMDEDQIDKAVREDDITLLKGDYIAEKWFYYKKYGNRDCFKTTPVELRHLLFKTPLGKELWENLCKSVKEEGGSF